MKTNHDFLNSMKNAFDLLRTAGPKEATAAVQRALAGGLSNAADSLRTHGRQHAGAATTANASHASSNAQAHMHPAADTTVDAHTPGTFSTHTFTNSAGQRQYKLYIPSSYAGEPLPLIVMLHGCTQNADDFATGTRMNEMAERHRLIVVYPNQTQAANPAQCWNWFKPIDQQRDLGEPSLIAGITREVIARYRVDPTRVYVAGLSAGGAMADIMLNTSPELYAAGCVHSGLAYGSAKDLPSALAAMKGGHANRHRKSAASQRPLIVFQGDADATVHPSNADALMAPFGAHVTLMDVPSRVAGGRHACTVHKGVSASGVEAEYWSIHGAAHAWAGGDPRGSYTDAAGPDASSEMLRFFLAHPKLQ